MKEEHTEIDNLFKKGLYDMEQDVQVDAWSKISGKIDAQKLSNTSSASSVSKTWMYYAAASMIIIIAASVWINAKTNTKETAHSTADNNTKTSNTILSKENYSIQPATDIQTIEKTSFVTKDAESKKSPSIIQIRASEDRKSAALPDGSVVLLNRNSSISYSADYANDYTVYVTGEVFFDLASNSSKGIHVVTPLTRIDASESSFIISSDKENNSDEITVASGKVSCGSVIENQDRMLILAGNKAVIGSSGKVKEEPISDINYNDWVTQRIVFTNTKLNTVFSTLEKYYNVSLTTNNTDIMNCRFTGTFERNNIDEILQVLSVSFDLSFNQNNKKYILSGSGCK